jgi:hypothetical protein
VEAPVVGVGKPSGYSAHRLQKNKKGAEKCRTMLTMNCRVFRYLHAGKPMRFY